jgi:hypothetical protein
MVLEFLRARREREAKKPRGEKEGRRSSLSRQTQTHQDQKEHVSLSLFTDNMH